MQRTLKGKSFWRMKPTFHALRRGCCDAFQSSPNMYKNRADTTIAKRARMAAAAKRGICSGFLHFDQRR